MLYFFASRFTTGGLLAIDVYRKEQNIIYINKNIWQVSAVTEWWWWWWWLNDCTQISFSSTYNIIIVWRVNREINIHEPAPGGYIDVCSPYDLSPATLHGRLTISPLIILLYCAVCGYRAVLILYGVCMLVLSNKPSRDRLKPCSG